MAGWVACGSERISYAGWQIGIAYYLALLQGYGPTLDMQTARDRVIGVILGNLVVLVVFTAFWPGQRCAGRAAAGGGGRRAAR